MWTLSEKFGFLVVEWTILWLFNATINNISLISEWIFFIGGENQRVPRDSTKLLKVSTTLNSVSNTTSHG